MFNIKLTTNQAYLIDKHILDLSNVRLGGTLTSYKNLDLSDVYRVIIHNSKSYDGKYHYLSNMTIELVKYIIGEIGYYTSDSFERERSERIIASGLIKKLQKYSTIENRRDLTLNMILS